MKKSRRCPKCDSLEIAVQRLSLANSDELVYVCAGCGYHEHYYARPRDWLAYLEQEGGRVQWINATPAEQGPYR